MNDNKNRIRAPKGVRIMDAIVKTGIGILL